MGPSPYTRPGVDKPPVSPLCPSAQRSWVGQVLAPSGAGVPYKWRRCHKRTCTCAANLHSVRSDGAGTPTKNTPAPFVPYTGTSWGRHLRHSGLGPAPRKIKRCPTTGFWYERSEPAASADESLPRGEGLGRGLRKHRRPCQWPSFNRKESPTGLSFLLNCSDSNAD